jgi:hypothetical protein
MKSFTNAITIYFRERSRKIVHHYENSFFWASSGKGKGVVTTVNNSIIGLVLAIFVIKHIMFRCFFSFSCEAIGGDSLKTYFVDIHSDD